MSDPRMMLGYTANVTNFEEQKELLKTLRAETNVFLSLQIGEEFSPEYCAKTQEMCNWLAAQGLRIIADVSQKTVQRFAQPDLPSLANQLHIWALRIDYGFTTEEICALAARFPIVLNASTTTQSDAKQIASAGKLVMAMHNFYPRPETGLDAVFLLESTRALQACGLKVLGFVPGDENRRGPLHEGLPTLERHRNLPPSVAFADLALTFGLDGIFLGDPGISAAQRANIDRFCTEGVLTLPAKLDPAYAHLFGQVFTNRPDSPAWLVRFQESREYSCYGGAHAPQSPQKRLRGTITVDNDLYGRYAGEVQLLRQDFAADKRVNVIGKVAQNYLPLVDCILRGERFVLQNVDV